MSSNAGDTRTPEQIAEDRKLAEVKLRKEKEDEQAHAEDVLRNEDLSGVNVSLSEGPASLIAARSRYEYCVQAQQQEIGIEALKTTVLINKAIPGSQDLKTFESRLQAANADYDSTRRAVRVLDGKYPKAQDLMGKLAERFFADFMKNEKAV